MDIGSVTDFVHSHVSEIALLVGGLIALLIVYMYIKDGASKKYKASMVLGVIFGVVMIFLSLSSYTDWKVFDAVLIAVMGFTLMIRPFRDVHFAIIGALLVMVLAYIFLGGLSGTVLDILADSWPRIIAAFLIGAVVYMILGFAEAIVKLFGKLFNWWPFLLVLALVCILEAILLFMGYGSLYSILTGSQ